MKHLKLIVLLITILTIKSTAFTQTSSDSVKCFSYEQAREIANKLKKAHLCDSTAQTQALQIIYYKRVVNRDFQIIALNNAKISRQTKDINKLGLKLKISKQLSFIGIPTAVIGGFIAGILMSK